MKVDQIVLGPRPRRRSGARGAGRRQVAQGREAWLQLRGWYLRCTSESLAVATCR
jgi:hypothetical protein